MLDPPPILQLSYFFLTLVPPSQLPQQHWLKLGNIKANREMISWLANPSGPACLCRGSSFTYLLYHKEKLSLHLLGRALFECAVYNILTSTHSYYH